MRTAKYREIEVQDDQGNILGVYGDVNRIADEFDISKSRVYFAITTAIELKKKKLFFKPREIIETRDTFVTMSEEVPFYAKRYAEAKSREERIKIRSEFCDKFRNISGYGDEWAKIAMKTIDYKTILGKRRDQSNRKTSNRPVVQLDGHGNVINRYNSIKEASEDLFVSYHTAIDYLKGNVKKPQFILVYGDQL